MTQINQLQSDLGYVRDALRKSNRTTWPAHIYLLWAAITLVGFALIDFAPKAVLLYWAVVCPLGLLASSALGWRYSQRLGQAQRTLGIRYSVHFLGMMAIMFLAVPLGMTGAISWVAMGKIYLLVIALAYFLAGIHMDRSLLWVSAAMLAGYGLLFFISAYAWTIVGALIALALAVTGLLGGRQNAPATN